MKKITLLAALSLSAAFASAQITAGSIGTGAYTNYAGSTSQCYGIDFDNNGTLEVAIKAGYDMGGNEYDYSSLEYLDNVIQIAVPNGDAWDVLRLFNAGEMINASTLFAGYGDAMFDDCSVIGSTTVYVGFAVTLNGSTHYAYAPVTRSGNSLVWGTPYINMEAGSPIAAGQTNGGTSAIQNADQQSSVSGHKYYKQGHIFIERDGKTYDLSGRRLN